jgi:predicted RNA-binding protein with RPS1 domain
VSKRSKIEVEIKETEEEKEKNKDNGKKEEKKFKIEIVEEVRTMPAILQEKGRVSKTPVLRKPYITPGFGPLALKYGSIVMGKSLKTGLVAYNEEKFQEFCDMISDALQEKEQVTLVIKDWGKDEIPKEYMIVLPNNNLNHTIQ